MMLLKAGNSLYGQLFPHRGLVSELTKMPCCPFVFRQRKVMEPLTKLFITPLMQKPVHKPLMQKPVFPIFPLTHTSRKTALYKKAVNLFLLVLISAHP